MVKNSARERGFKIILHAFFILLSVCFIIPLWSIIAISFSDDKDIIKYGYSLIPKNISFAGYDILFRNPEKILTAYKVTIIISFVGVAIYLIIASMAAYSTSRRDFKLRKPVTFYIFFTMLFNGGLVPTYILMTQYLGLRNNYGALIIPLLGNVWYVIILRTFFQQLPTSIIESATIDGAGEYSIYVKIILPLSTPALATVGFMQLLNNWNSWFQALMYVDKESLYPLQYLLQSILRNIQELTQSMDNRPANIVSNVDLPTESTRMAMAIMAIGPMLLAFPFVQKYFVSGLTVGAVKG